MARNIKRYARGGIVDSPEAFAFARGLGVMGEAGPEAVLPLTRLGSGELGVKALLPRLPEVSSAASAQALNITDNNHIDARGADRSGLLALERRMASVERFLASNLRGVIIGTVLDSRRRAGDIVRAFGAC